ncbi:endonuclease/exonuclease/phosphatase family protein [Foetidibacter luteolus]|uniref:endonuclease/exonuclease/phosphatase family protein n=1 Tax=Foetidibacter luteolus TaxID=2608880 RepID=UPI00129BD16A|nr:endonuclease/exonuclease/phosphatase family protein [Foetidibacter luteolus]
MKKLFLIVSLLLMLQARAQTSLKVLSYNIYHGELNYQPGKASLDSIAALIRKLQPDFVACQEVDSATGRVAKIYGQRIDLMQELAKKTGMYGYFGKAMDFDGGGYGEGLLTKNPVTASTVVLPNPSGGEPRALLYAHYTLPGGRVILLGGTHLCHEHEANKVAQVAAINKVMGSSAYPSVVCGDFNFTSGSRPYQLMAKAWFDAADVKGNPQNSFSYKKPAVRIDYAFLSKPHSWKVVDVQVIPVSYSDHMPVLFTLQLAAE